jgi:hypothetical protein
MLIIGGGSMGAGTDALYQASDIDRIGADIYAAKHVVIIADGHHLPYAGDAANAAYFLGSRAEKPLAPHDMIAYYPGPR